MNMADEILKLFVLVLEFLDGLAHLDVILLVLLEDVVLLLHLILELENLLRRTKRSRIKGEMGLLLVLGLLVNELLDDILKSESFICKGLLLHFHFLDFGVAEYLLDFGDVFFFLVEIALHLLELLLHLEDVVDLTKIDGNRGHTSFPNF